MPRKGRKTNTAGRYSLSKQTRKWFMGLANVGLATGLIGGMAYLKNAIGSVTVDIGGTTIDLTIIPVLGVTAFGVYLLFKSARLFGVRI